MPRTLVAFVLAVLVTNSGCSTPVAVGAVVAGGGSLVGAKVLYKENCDGEGCVYGNLMAALLGVIGLGLMLGGGIGLAVDQNEH